MSNFRSEVMQRFPMLARVWRGIKYHPRFAGSPEEIFTNIYQGNKWKNPESLSGSGSTLAETEQIRLVLPGLLAELRCRSMLDVPCGDFNWMRFVSLEVDYIGGDIVADLVTVNQARYGNERRRFVRLDLLQDCLPAADLILCRDCLVHLSYHYIFQALTNIRASGATYLLTTTFENQARNVDTITPVWRAINLRLPPFSFPPPLRLIDECARQPLSRGKHLGLWRVADLPQYDR